MMFIFTRLLILFLFICGLSGCNTNDLTTLPLNKTIALKGTLTTTGHAPFEQLSIRLKKINQPLPLLFKYQSSLDTAQNKKGKKVSLKGQLTKKTRHTADLKQSIQQYLFIVHEIK